MHHRVDATRWLIEEAAGPTRGSRHGNFDFHESDSCNISGIWCNLSPALIRFVTAPGRPALDFHSCPRSCEVSPVAVERLVLSLVAQLGGLLCFLRRLNYSSTKISRLTRFYCFLLLSLLLLLLFYLIFFNYQRINYKDYISMLVLTRHHVYKEQRLWICWQENIKLEGWILE